MDTERVYAQHIVQRKTWCETQTGGDDDVRACMCLRTDSTLCFAGKHGRVVGNLLTGTRSGWDFVAVVGA